MSYRRRLMLPAVLVLPVAFLCLAQPAAQIAQISGITAPPCNPGPEERPWLNAKQEPECRALEVIAQMTQQEKLAQITGITGGSGIPRLGLLSGGGSDGPNGIATMSGNPQPRGQHVTAFANAVTLAATWDRDLAGRFGKAVGEEFNGKGSNSVLGPTINIMRTWHWGRNGETLSEDPYLTAELAVAEIRALNDQKVLTVLKHYAGNNQDNTRVGVVPDNAGIDERITEKALHEIYLPAFKAAVERAHTGGIMCSYNQINGKFSCNNPELLGLLRKWGFDGFIAPDAAFALRDPLVASLAGVTRPGAIGPAIADGKLTAGDLDRMVFYNLVPYFRLGIFDGPSKGAADADVSTPEHVALSRQVAEEGAVLLKNRNAVLPIDAAKVKSIAVIGDDAGPNVTVVLSGSAHVAVSKLSVPVDAITARAGSGIKVEYARATLGIGPLPTIPVEVLKPSSGGGQGLLASYYNAVNATGSNSTPLFSRVEPGVQVTAPPAEFNTAVAAAAAPAGRGAEASTPGAAPPQAGQPSTPAGQAVQAAAQAVAQAQAAVQAAQSAAQAAQLAAQPAQAAAQPAPSQGPAGRGGPTAGGRGGGGGGRGRSAWSARWTGTLTPPATGLYRFSMTGAGTAQLYVDHVAVATMMRADFAETVQGAINLKAGKAVPIEVKYNSASSVLGGGVQLGWEPPGDLLSAAVAAAKRADMAIVFAAEQLGEGQDKPFLALPGGQDELIEAVAQANPRTAVVLHTSNPVSMPWLDRVAAVVEAFYPGQEAGSSIARVLFGDVNPSGRLAMTFPATEQQGPATHFLEYPGDGITVDFNEGALVGYRWYDAKNQEPLFPFGFGLSYTTFRYSDLQVTKSGGRQATVRVRIANTGKKEGAEVAELYLGFPAASEEPPKQLRGFEKVRLKPGESKVVTMEIDQGGLGAWDSDAHEFRVYPGSYTVMVGASSRDIRLKGAFAIAN